MLFTNYKFEDLANEMTNSNERQRQTANKANDAKCIFRNQKKKETKITNASLNIRPATAIGVFRKSRKHETTTI